MPAVRAAEPIRQQDFDRLVDEFAARVTKKPLDFAIG